ncbi:MAG: hypothetical protein R2939_22455 [Kofleriaceae bacterium]
MLGRYWPPARRLVDDGYRELAVPGPALPTPTLAIEHTWDLAQLGAYVATWSATQALRAAGDDAAFAAAWSRLAGAWGEPGRRRLVRWPLVIRASRLGVAAG